MCEYTYLNTTMTVAETIFIFICKLLCIPLFKKIWIVKDSYWNKTRINKDNINDLQPFQYPYITAIFKKMGHIKKAI